MKIWPILRLLSVYIVIAHSKDLVDSTDNGATSADRSQSSHSQSQDGGTPSPEPAQEPGLSSQQSGSNGHVSSDDLTQSSNQQDSEQDKSGTTPVTQPDDNSTQASSETDDGVSEDVSATPDGSDGDGSSDQASNLVDVDIGKENGTDMYDFSNGIYTAKQGYKFKRIVKGTHEIRKFDDSKCPVKIDVFFDEGTILLSVYEGTTSTFTCSVIDDPDKSSTPSGDGSQSGDLGTTPSDSSSIPKSEPDGSTPTSGGSEPQTPSGVPDSSSSVSEATTPSVDGSPAKPESDGSSVSEGDQSSQTSGSSSDQSSPDGAEQDKSGTPKDGDGSTSNPPSAEEGSPSSSDGDADQSSAPESGSTTPDSDSSTPTSVQSEDQTPSGVTETTTTEEGGSTDTKTASVLQASEVFADHLKFITKDDQGSTTDDKNKLDIHLVIDLSNYTFKKGSKCTELNYDNQTVWKHDPNVHGDKYPNNVLLNTTTKFIVLECTGVYQYFYSFFNNQWNQIFSYTSDSIKLNMNKLKFMTQETVGTPKEIDQTKFDKSEEGSIVKYKFKVDSKCVEVKYDQRTVWKYESSVHANKYPTTVIVNADNNLLTVDSSGNYRHFYSYYQGNFKHIFAYKTGLKKLDPGKLKFMTQETVGTPKEIDQTKFDKSEEGSIVKYKFKVDSKCVEVKYDETTVWKYDDSVHGTNYPTSLTLNTLRNVVMVKSSDKYTQMYTYYEDNWSTGPSHGIKSHFKLDKLKLVTLESGGTTKENDTTKYNKKVEGSIISYEFKDGAKCTRVNYDNDAVWEHDPNIHGEYYPTGLTLNLNTSFMLLESKKQYQHFYSYFDGRWNSTFSYKSHAITENLDKSKLKVFTVNQDGTSSVNDPTKYEVKESAEVYTYTFKPEAVCFRVNYEDILVWEYNEDKHGDHYPTSLVFNMTNELIMVESKNEYLHFYSFYRSEWRPVMGAVSQVPAPVAQPTAKYSMPAQLESAKVKLKFTDSAGNVKENDTSVFYLSEKYHMLTYNFHSEAKCSEILYDEVSVWKVSDHTGTNPPKQLVMNKSANTVHVDCNEKFFMYQLLDSKWNLVSTFDPNLPRTPESQDKSDKTKLELLGEKSEGTTASLDNTSYDSSEDSELKLLTYKFKDDVKCTEVKYRGSSAWKHDDTVSGGKHPKAVYLHTDVERVVVEFDGFYLRYEFKDNKCNFVLLADTSHFDESKFKLYTLYDNDYTKCYLDTNKYDVVKSYNEIQYRLKSDAKCLRVRYKGKLVWKHDKGDFSEHHPKTVTYNLDTRRAIVHFDKNWHYCYQHTFVYWKVVKSVEDAKATDIPQKDPNYKPEEVEEFQHPPNTESQGLPKTQSTDGCTPTTPSADGSQSGDGGATPSDSTSTPKTEGDGSTPTSGGSEPQEGQSQPKPTGTPAQTAGGQATPARSGGQGSTPGTQQPSQTTPAGAQSQPPKTGPTSGQATPKPGAGQAAPVTQAQTGVELDIKKKAGTNEFDYSKDGKIGTYTAKEDHAFKSVKEDQTEIWKTDKSNEYATKVIMDGIGFGKTTKNVTIFLTNNMTKAFVKDGNSWKEAGPDGVELGLDGKLLLNLDYDKDKASNDKYEYKEETDKRIYTAKDGYNFKSLKIKGIKLWESDGKTYATKLEVSGPDDENKYHTKADLGGANYAYATINPDELKKQADQKKYTVDKTKVKLFAANNVELTVDNNHFKIKDEYDGATKYDLLANSNCVEVKYNDESIWKIDPNKHGNSYPINLYFLADGMFKVAINSQFDEVNMTSKLQSSSGSPAKPSGGS